MVSAPDPLDDALGLAALAHRLELAEDQQLLGAEAERAHPVADAGGCSLPTVANGAPFGARGSRFTQTAHGRQDDGAAT